jgi:hypothetical protein
MKTLVIELRYPDNVGLAEIKRYAHDALEQWGGQFCSGTGGIRCEGCPVGCPGDPLFYTTKAPISRMKGLK